MSGQPEKKEETMGFLRALGIGKKELLARGAQTRGVVEEVKTCWWIKVNQKPVRRSALDGAAFPHLISFRYEVGGMKYRGSWYVSWNRRPPAVGEVVVVYYDHQRPERSALEL